MGLTAQESKILYLIQTGSENDPSHPEYPVAQPKFPATPTIKIDVPGFTNVWLKDESKNLTGTHKDRMAWELVMTYRDILLAKKNSTNGNPLPQMSVVTAGAEGIAIQTLFRRYGLPNVKCLVDRKTDEKIMNALQHLGCEVFVADVLKKNLSWKEILRLTKNTDGIDATFGEGLDPTTRFYDWLSYEILNEVPEYCFLPFFSGQLFENVLNIAKKEALSSTHDPRFSGDTRILQKCNFIAAALLRSDFPRAFFAPHLIVDDLEKHWLRIYRLTGCCGADSGIFAVSDIFVKKAFEIARTNGIDCDFQSMTGLGLLLQHSEHIPKHAKILIVNAGKAKLPELINSENN